MSCWTNGTLIWFGEHSLARRVFQVPSKYSWVVIAQLVLPKWLGSIATDEWMPKFVSLGAVPVSRVCRFPTVVGTLPLNTNESTASETFRFLFGSV